MLQHASFPNKAVALFHTYDTDTDATNSQRLLYRLLYRLPRLSLISLTCGHKRSENRRPQV